MRQKNNTFQKIYNVVKKIPVGKVSTYGDISRFLMMKNPKIIGWALHANKDKNIPCHRVVTKNGNLSKNYAFGGEKMQKEKLLNEGVRFKKDTVDLKKSKVCL
jgi:methylated-DNA-protein-cysteine methyltransferase-like protein